MASSMASLMTGTRQVPPRNPQPTIMNQQRFVTGGSNSQVIPLLSNPEVAVKITNHQREKIIANTAKQESKLPLLMIKKSAISLYSWEDMRAIAGPIRVNNLADAGNGSVNDPRMGTVSLNTPCPYCLQIDCTGHYGLIEFKHPIYNPTVIRRIVSVLKCVCNDCGGLLVTEDIIRRKGWTRLSYDKRLTEMEKHCDKSTCLRKKPQIGEGPITSCSKNPQFVTTDIAEKGEITYKIPVKGNGRGKDEQIHPMPIDHVINILDRISVKDAHLLGFPGYHRQLTSDIVLDLLDKVDVKTLEYNGIIAMGTHRQRLYRDVVSLLERLSPEFLAAIGLMNIQMMSSDVVLRTLDVLSPDILSQMGIMQPINHRQRNYDNLTNILDSLPEEILRGFGFPRGSHPRNMIMRGILVPPVIARPPVYDGGTVHFDQLTIMYINIMRKVQELESGKSGAVGNLYTAIRQLIFKTEGKKLGMKDYHSIVERIQGKEALLRGLLMGKRNNYCGRTVAGPDPSVEFGKIRLPEVWAKVLTKKVKVTAFNIANLSALLAAGRINHITPARTGIRFFYEPTKRYTLQIGDTVERWLQNGDRVVVNRQPTLHRLSMMAYEVILGYPLSIGLHLSYTSPMNCDFDGDENNVWCPEDFEVEAETEIILNVKSNLMSSEQNRPSMGFVMNSITGAYLLSDPTTRINDDLFAELLDFVTDQKSLDTLAFRLEKYGIHPRSGQAILSAMFPVDFFYENKGVLIMEGILVSGRLTKSHVGASSRSIIQEMYKSYGSQRTADFFTDGPWIINKWLIEHGFSVGLKDMISLGIDPNTGAEYDKSVRVLKKELAQIYVQLEALGGKLEDKIEEEYRRRKINELVNASNGIGLKIAKEVLSGDNAIGTMTDQGAGTKGSVANIGQMFGCVGQQFYHSERLKQTITGGKRLLPTHDLNDNNPEAHGFIANSFYTGLTPEELFCLQEGGRENLLDTALKTAETGAMQHRMGKAFENIVIGHDGSIRNTIGTMFCPMYNSGYDIGNTITISDSGKPSFVDIKSLVSELNVNRGWIKESVNEKILNERRKVVNESTNFVENILNTTEQIHGPPITNTVINYDINAPVQRRESSNKLTKFEKARIIGTRAMQLSNNAVPLVDIRYTLENIPKVVKADIITARVKQLSEGSYPKVPTNPSMDPISIAQSEFDQGLLDLGNEIDPVNIATKEYNAGILQLYVVRKFADDSYHTVYPTLDNI